MLKQNIILKALQSVLLMFLITTTITVTAQENKWKIDAAHSKVSFSIPYFKIGNIKGEFQTYEGLITANDENFENANLNITIQTASINTNHKERDIHLREVDFFDVKNHPKITFVSTSFKKTTENVYEIKGEFTMTGITKNLTLKAIYKGSFLHPKFQKTIGVFEITGIIPREDFHIGTNYPAAKVLGKEVALIAEIHTIRLN